MGQPNLSIQPAAERGFASALHYSAPFAALVAEARQRFVTRVTRAFLERFEPKLPADLVASIERLPEHANSLRQAVDRALLALNAPSSSATECARTAAVRAAVFLAAAGVPLQLDCELPAPIRLRWREWLVRGVRRVTSHPATAGLLRIETPNGEQLLTRTAAPDFGGVVPVPLATLGCTTVQLIFPWAIESGVVLPAGARLSALPSNELTAMLQGGLGLLHNASPAYDAWCSRVLSDVFTLDGSDGATRSASDASVLGHVAVSAPASPLQIAELFVHESTHQYFHLAEQLGPLHDGSDAHLYYSPVKRCPRPIERILLAHHAFANILLFYRCVIERELDCTGDAQASFDRHARSLRQLELALDATQALTALGRALYLPYRDLIAM